MFTQPYATQLVVAALEEAATRGSLKEEQITPEILENFLSKYGRAFYGLPEVTKKSIVLRKKDEKVREAVCGSGVEVVPFKTGEEIWSLDWL